MRVLFLHPDLGIGGAERLVVDAAVGLQESGHQVVVYTSHHDRTHCFEETRDGTLDVRVYGDFLPRSIFGRCMVLCAIVRGIYLALVVALLGHLRQADVVFCDQVSAWIPILKYTGARVFFYCHFPDMMLSQRKSLLKRLYRIPFDAFEAWTTGMADDIAVNSKFTAGVFRDAFPHIRHTPQVLYPGIRLAAYDRPIDTAAPTLAPLATDRTTIVSINRFERKKNIGLAVRGFLQLRDQQLVASDEFTRLRLVIAGGYDRRVAENVEHLAELRQLAEDNGLVTYTVLDHTAPTPDNAQVVFLPSFDEMQRSRLLSIARCLLYTPSGEHFGIVPVEAMYARLPVIAVADGGPTESVKHGETGYLCRPEPAAFAEAMRDLLCQSDSERTQMGDAGRSWTRSQFSLETFVERLTAMLTELVSKPVTSSRPSLLWPFLVLALLTVGILRLLS